MIKLDVCNQFIFIIFFSRNKYEVPNLQMDSPVGLYNIPQQRTSQAFSSMDDLDAMVVAQKQLSGMFCSISSSLRYHSILDRAEFMFTFHLSRPDPELLISTLN